MLKPFYQQDVLEAGCDEAGRGSYAGPVFAAAVILPVDFFHPLLNDSKLLSEKTRNLLKLVIEKKAISFGVASVDNDEIDHINILKASFKAMHIAINRLDRKPKRLLIDGNSFIPYQKVSHHCIIKGDGIYTSIAAASILAKTYRDEFMKKLHREYPQYGWEDNKGYGTEFHRKAIEQFGLCKYHRKSFQILRPPTLLI